MGWAVSMTLLFGGCTGSGAPLVIDLVTDLDPTVEFDAVRVERLEGDSVGRFVLHAPAAGANYLAGERVSELEVVERDVRLRVALLLGGDVVVERPVLVSVDGPTAITVVVSRNCRGVSCPGAGDDPSETACLAGRCVDPTCVEENPAACEPTCELDAECAAPAAACATAHCTAAGVCLAAATEGACAPDEYCAAETGCEPRTGGGAGGSCSDGGSCTCPPGETCSFMCTTPSCNVSCERDSVCTVSCPAGGCDMHCDSGAQCDLDCPAGDCGVVCDSGSRCSGECLDADCFVACEGGAECGMVCGAGMRGTCDLLSCTAGLCPIICGGGGCSRNFLS